MTKKSQEALSTPPRRQVNYSTRPNLRLLVCTANLGNEQPDAASIAKWIPPDGFFVEDPTANNVSSTVSTAAISTEVSSESVSLSTSSSDEEEDTSAHPAMMYETKYPLRSNDDDDDDDDDDSHDEEDLKTTLPRPLVDEEIMMNALSKQLDLIVIGLQESTFDPPKTENGKKDAAIGIYVPIVKPLRRLQTLRIEKDYSKAVLSPNSSLDESERSGSSQRSTRSPFKRGTSSNLQLSSSTRTRLTVVNRDSWEGGIHVLHSLFEGRLPSFTRLVSYQRGQMRLMVFARRQSTTDPNGDPPLPIQVLHTAAQNTGMAGLANKGGIVTEVLVNSGTRLSFVTCHLEAHEGAAKYAVRCQTIADILRGTAARKKVIEQQESNNCDDEPQPSLERKDSAHHVLPTPSSQPVQASAKTPDVSMTAHYCFVLGDLNFRTDLSLVDPAFADREEEHKQTVRDLVERKDWDALNKADELHNALRRKDCLVGFRTLFCNFPPTFKLERQAGYQYIEKRRPSYTDRILYKTGHQLEHCLRPLIYEPIDEFTTSDHKPVRAAFSLDLNPPFRFRPRTVRENSVRWVNDEENAINKGRDWRLPLSLKRLIRNQHSTNENDSVGSKTSVVVDLSSGQGFGSSGDRLQLFVSNISVTLAGGADNSMHNYVSNGPNPYVMLTSYPAEAICAPSDPVGSFTKLFRCLGLKRSSSEGSMQKTKDGWPCTSKKSNTACAAWEDEEIDCEVRTHTHLGSSLDLTGALLLLNVMNANNMTGIEDTLLGSVSFNLANLLQTCARNKQLASGRSARQSQANHRRVRRRSIFGFRKSSVRSGGNLNDPPTNERRSGFLGSFLGYNRSDASMDEDDDPIASVDISQAFLRDGVERGMLKFTIEAWWMNEQTAKLIRVPRNSERSLKVGSNMKFAFRSRSSQEGVEAVHHKAEKRAAFTEKSPTFAGIEYDR